MKNARLTQGQTGHILKSMSGGADNSLPVDSEKARSTSYPTLIAPLYKLISLSAKPDYQILGNSQCRLVYTCGL